MSGWGVARKFSLTVWYATTLHPHKRHDTLASVGDWGYGNGPSDLGQVDRSGILYGFMTIEKIKYGRTFDRRDFCTVDLLGIRG